MRGNSKEISIFLTDMQFKNIVYLTVVAIILTLPSCAPSDKELQKFARFNAKRLLIEEYCKMKPESLFVYTASLYKNENINQNRIIRIISYLDKNPDAWVKTQKLLVAELDSLNPAKTGNRKE